jgi:hypothetical protein
MYKIITLLSLLTCIVSTGNAQVIRVDELDVDGRDYTDIRNADVNSIIRLKLDAAILSKQVNKSATGLPQDVVTLLKVFTQTLEKRAEMVNAFKANIQAYKIESDPEKRKANAQAFNKRMKQVADQIVALFDLDPKLELYYAQQEDKGLLNPLFGALEKRVREMQGSLLNAGAYSDVSIQLGGWLIHNGEATALHFPGLDTNPVQEYYEVERWRFLPTEEQLKQFKQLEEMSRNSGNTEGDLWEVIKNTYIQDFTRVLKDRLSEESRVFEEEAKKILADPGAATIAKQINLLLDLGKKSKEQLSARLDYYTNLRKDPGFSLSQLTSAIRSDIELVNATQKEMIKALEQLKTDVEAAEPAIRNQCKELLTLTAQRLKALPSQIIDPAFLGEITNGTGVELLALEFSRNVLSLSFGELPSNIETDLHLAGPRETGDHLQLKLVIKKGTDKQPILEERKIVKLYMIAPHLEGTVGVIFAHPLQPTAIQKDFQMAPYYNLLFKGVMGVSRKWQRQSSLPNTLLNLSFGLHVSSPDFDKDDVPELGVGVVASTFWDYLQFGWAYNVFQGSPYLFFGLRLPVPSMNFGSNAGNPASGK